MFTYSNRDRIVSIYLFPGLNSDGGIVDLTCEIAISYLDELLGVLAHTQRLHQGLAHHDGEVGSLEGGWYVHDVWAS